ncbi:hypothetical protein LCGC14_1434200 [marine sediment metagenome]|uniref:Phage gp6-like head-tail connector protein n=1 Tax=marine sediment metagenome TaxID=412755 RepID=A0A0F9K8V9_9ZZZZ
MALKLVTGPVVEPVSLGNMKEHLRIVDFIIDDDYISLLIKAARESAETFQSRSFITQTWDLFLDEFPERDPIIRVPKPPLQSVTTVKYTDASGVVQELVAVTDYQVDTKSEPGRISPAFGMVWPVTRAVLNAVEIRFLSGGIAAADVLEKIKMAIKQIVAHWYEHREEISEIKLARVPHTAVALLWENRNFG